jgi:hypothetical protein
MTVPTETTKTEIQKYTEELQKLRPNFESFYLKKRKDINILLADNSSSIRRIVSKILKDSGFEEST